MVQISRRAVVLGMVGGAGLSGLTAVGIAISGDDGDGSEASDSEDRRNDGDGDGGDVAGDLGFTPSVVEGEEILRVRVTDDDREWVRSKNCDTRAVCVRLTVQNSAGEPIADEPVTLVDRGGSPDERIDRTQRDGEAHFFEGVGPPPCNEQRVEFPNRGASIGLGCNDGTQAIALTAVFEE